MQAADQLSPTAGTAPTCAALGVARATLYRHRSRSHGAPAAAPVERSSAAALDAAERQAVLATLHSERFVDQAPAAVYARAARRRDRISCSERTMYRLLEGAGEVRERRDQLRHPVYAKPELLASRPNEVWSWDITKLLGPAKWTYFYLYVLLDIYSRYVVGWMVAHRESATLAKKLIAAERDEAGDRARAAHRARRPRLLDDLQAGGVAARRPRGDQDPLPAFGQQRPSNAKRRRLLLENVEGG